MEAYTRVMVVEVVLDDYFWHLGDSHVVCAVHMHRMMAKKQKGFAKE